MASGIRRDGKKEAFWRRLVLGHSGSGLTIRDWCGRHGVKEPAFYWWRTRLAQRDAEAPAFVPVRVVNSATATQLKHQAEPHAGSGGIEIVLGGGQRIRLCGRVDRQALADVLAVLESDSASESRHGDCSTLATASHPGRLEAPAC